MNDYTHTHTHIKGKMDNLIGKRLKIKQNETLQIRKHIIVNLQYFLPCSYNAGYSCLIMLPQEEEEKEEKEISKKKQADATQDDLALKEMTTPTAKEAQDQARARAVDKQEQLCELSRALAVLASASVSITGNCVGS